MEEKLIEILLASGYPACRQGSAPSSPDGYPPHFFTFWNTSSRNHSHYDGQSYGQEYMFDVFFYSIEPTTCYEALEWAKRELKSHGWGITNLGRDTNSGIATHVGRCISINFLKIEQEEKDDEQQRQNR